MLLLLYCIWAPLTTIKTRLLTHCTSCVYTQELERQVDSLEAERAKLLLTLRNNAASIGEKGFKYAGLSAEQLVQVLTGPRNALHCTRVGPPDTAVC